MMTSGIKTMHNEYYVKHQWCVMYVVYVCSVIVLKVRNIITYTTSLKQVDSFCHQYFVGYFPGQIWVFSMLFLLTGWLMTEVTIFENLTIISPW